LEEGFVKGGLKRVVEKWLEIVAERVTKPLMGRVAERVIEPSMERSVEKWAEKFTKKDLDALMASGRKE
jgi:hypothetical protein